MLLGWFFSVALQAARPVSEHNVLQSSESSDVFRERPDKADQLLALNDVSLGDDALDPHEYKSAAVTAAANNAQLDAQRDRLAAYLGVDEVSSLTSPDLWQRIHDWLMANWDSIVTEGYLGITLHVRYNFCLYIIMLIPAEAIFPLPSAYTFLVPRRAKRVPVISDFLKRLEEFLKFVKKRSGEQFLIPFTIGRRFSAKEDLSFVLRIPALISTDPIQVIRWFLDFELKADGFK
ncbi:hypothetical protein PAPHI01_0895 [Pancytospora philotis]|nr:hypothetical protein PAPHI01_0895 [Pancytospora philotis]